MSISSRIVPSVELTRAVRSTRRYSYGSGYLLAFVYFYLGMAALGLSLEAMITILTPKFIPYFLFCLVSLRTSYILCCPNFASR